MDLSQLPDDFFVTLSQFTKTTYRDVYPVVDPTSPALSQQGKVVIITGTSQGLGRHGFAQAFAKAGVKALVLVARNADGLEAAAREVKAVNPKIQVLTQAMDIRSEDEVKKLFSRIESEFGMADVLVNNAASGKSALPVRDVDPNDFWYDFDVNVKGTLLMSQGFLKLVGKEKPATIINISSAGGIAVIPSTSSYSLSKLVQIQIQRFIAAENPNITAISMHPGTVLTPITKPQFEKFSKDTYALAGD
ncbi:NAD(P)-binding protein [Mollisia scopiformis]|uniref:NAD(P)-binding protein n=1 Tax=Mollisia scopiformis TaxID=149040 RepID=A0A194XEZ3_MOLSC|nr:NAD(P)-binding protein [Mollisia scopiformis]KUJ18760.1 NAD(P)-binding protein [Mollisia scopiformis]